MSDRERPSKPSQRTRRRTPSVWVWCIVLLCCGGVGYFRWYAESMDFAIAFIATWGLIFLSITTLFVWYVAFSGYARRTRLRVLYGVLGANVLFWSLFRIDGVWGELWPSIRPRFARDRDATLADPGKGSEQPDLAAIRETDFPEFLGAGRRNLISASKLKPWTESPPQQVWRIPIGAGWSGFVAVNGFAVTMEQRGEVEWVTCYRMADGQPVWSHGIEARHKTVMGGIGPRSTPTISKGDVFALGATGVLRCLNGADGSQRWTQDLISLAGSSLKQEGKVVFWGRSASPLVVDDLVIVPLGGPAGGPFSSLVALQRQTGKVAWKSGDSQISYSSPTLAMVNGVRQILIVNEASISGHQVNDGKVLWTYDWPGNSTQDANASQVVHVSGNQLFVSKGYGAGAALFKVEANAAGGFKTEKVWHQRRSLKTKFTNVVISKGAVFGLSDGILECIDLATGKRRWKKGRYSQGQILGVGNSLIVQAETGDVHLIAQNADRFQHLGKLAALNGKTWNNVCVSGNRLLVRNAAEAACYELAKE